MKSRLSISYASIALALALTSASYAQEKAPDRPPDIEKTRRRDPRPEDDRPRREGDPRPEAGKMPEGPGPAPRSGFGGGGARGGQRGFGGGEFGGGFGGGAPGGAMPGGPAGMPGGMSGPAGPGGNMFGGAGGGFGFRGYGSPEPDDPEMRDLIRKDSEMERQTMDLAEQYRRASGEQRDKLKKDISELVARHFDVRQERRKLQLKRLEEELKRLRDAITKRDDSSDSIVKNRISELIGDPRELDF